MPDQNVELVRRVIDAMNRADFDAVTKLFSQDFEFDFSASKSPLSGVYRGRDEARGFLTSFFEPWAEVEFNPQGEMTEFEDGRVLTVNVVRGRGHGSGAEVAAKGASIWTIRNGEVAAVKLYQSKGEALEDAGLKG